MVGPLRWVVALLNLFRWLANLRDDKQPAEGSETNAGVMQLLSNVEPNPNRQNDAFSTSIYEINISNNATFDVSENH